MTVIEVVVHIREGKSGIIGQYNVDGVPLGITATADPMDPTPYPMEERPTKKLPAHNIGCRIKIESRVSQPDYWTRDCSGRLRQWRYMEAAMERG